MCGIVGYCGPRRVAPLVLAGLRRLEYRGYDSAGIVYPGPDGTLVKYRARGKLSQLEAIIGDAMLSPATIGLGHTRWATHGAPTTENAHPHSDCTGDLVVVHNGIIENYNSLRLELQIRGHKFASETDTEVLAHLIEENLTEDLSVAGTAQTGLPAAVRAALARVEGSYALGVMSVKVPDMLVVARNHSPLVLGVCDDGGMFVASDVPAFLEYTNQVIFLDDLEMAVLKNGDCRVTSLVDGTALAKKIESISWNAAMAEKAGYKHFMLKEIYEQPQAITNTLRGRVDVETGDITIPEIALDDNALQKIERIALVACGTSWHAAMVAKYWLERYAQVPTEVDIASEFRYRHLLLNERVLTVAISQSGETADTLAGIRRAKDMGANVVAICNVVGSTMTRESDGTVYTHAGPEIGVASTKAFTAQLTALFLFSLYLGQKRGVMPRELRAHLVKSLLAVATVIETALPKVQAEINALVEKFYACKDFLFVGRGLNFPIALEGALKLKEISYIHAEGYASGELKHGPIALIDKEMPVLALLPRDDVYLKSVSNVEEIKARQGRLVLIGTEGDEHLLKISSEIIYLPKVDDALNPLLYTIPAQLLAYEMAARRGCDVDQPRNLAKSVTVE